jgi:hypothetical protein
MPGFATAREYLRQAHIVSAHWDRSFSRTLARMVLSRARYHRGPGEYDSYRFALRPLREWSDYIDPAELLARQTALSPAAYRYLDENKVAFAEHCRRFDLRTAAIIGVIAFESWDRPAPSGIAVVRSGVELERLFASQGTFDGFAKPMRAALGNGAFAFRVEERMATSCHGTMSCDAFVHHCANSPFAGEGYLLQPRVRPHPMLAPLMPGPGLGTVRVITFLNPDGEVSIPLANLKVPAPGAECDNVRRGSLVAPVDVASGRLGNAVGATAERPVFDVVRRHPVTGVAFDGFQLPWWAEVRDLVTRGARAFHRLPALGWDVAIAEDGPMLMETSWQFSAPDGSHDRGFAAEFTRLFAEVARTG